MIETHVYELFGIRDFEFDLHLRACEMRVSFNEKKMYVVN